MSSSSSPVGGRTRANEHQSSTSVAAVSGLVAKSLACPAVLSVPARHIVVFAPNSLSDVLFCLPALAALRESFHGAQLSCVARSWLAPLVRDTHLVDEVLERPRGGLSAQASLLLKLHAHKPDIALTFSPTRDAVLMVWSSGAPVRAGFEEAKMEALLTHSVKRNGPPRIEAFLELARFLGCKTPHLDYRGLIEAEPQALSQAQALLDEKGVPSRFILAAPNVNNPIDARPLLDWGSEKWARTLSMLSSSWPVVLIGSASPHPARPNSEHGVFDLGGHTDLPLLAALCSKASLLVAGDGGLLHLACAMKIPVVGLYSPDDAGKTEPRGPRRILSAGPEREPAQVLEAARDLIGL